MAGTLNGAASGALWGVLFVIPLILRDFTPLQLAASRYLIYGALASAILWPRREDLRRLLDKSDFLTLVLLSLTGNIVYYLMLTTGVQWAGTAATTLIVGMIPVTITLVGYRSDKSVPLKRLAGPILLCVLGVGLVTLNTLKGNELEPGSSSKTAIWGLLAATAALVTWSAYSIQNIRWLARKPQLTAMEGSLLVGVVTGAFAILLAFPAFFLNSTHHTSLEWTKFWAVNAVAGILGSIVANSFWNRAARQLPLTMIGQMIVFETIFALLYGFLWESRMPTAVELAAIISLVGGVLWCAKQHAAARRS